MNKLIGKVCFYGCLFFVILACNTEYNTVGVDLIATDQFETQTREFPVYISVDTLVDIQASQFTFAHLGRFDFPNLGRRTGSITSQLASFPNPTFGSFSQKRENEGDADNPAIISENEQVTSVYLEIPFLYNQDDADGDGLVDAFDADPSSTESDSDGDGLTDLTETQANTNPLDADSDGDGINDSEDDDNSGYDTSDNVYDLEHIYGDSEQPIRLKVVELTHYFSSLDPDNNFETGAIYYAGRDFYEEGFVGRTLFDDTFTINREELVFYYDEDDETTPDVDETQEVESRLTPRIRLPLDTAYFQEKLLDQEGEDVLANQNNFNQFIKALHIRLDDSSHPLYLLLNMSQSRVIVNYTYDRYNDQGTTDDTSDDAIETAEKSYTMNFSGVQINHMQTTYEQQAVHSQEKMVIMGGVGTRGNIHLFDQDSTTTVLEDFKSTQILLNEANLVFYVDPDFAANWTEGDYIAERLFLYSQSTNTPLQDYFIDDSNTPESGFKFLHGGILEYQDGVPYRYKFRITQHVSNLIRATEDDDIENTPLGLVVSSDISNLAFRKGIIQHSTEELDFPLSAIQEPAGTILLGPSPNAEHPELRLRLEIIYTDFSN